MENRQVFQAQEFRSSAMPYRVRHPLLIENCADELNPDSRTRAMLFLIPDCAARQIPDSRRRAMSFSFPDYAKSLIPDLRLPPMSFSIPDSAGAPFPDVVSVDRARKSPGGDEAW